MISDKALRRMALWRSDWNLFCREVLRVNLDREQQEIITSVQNNPMTAVASGTARGKDFVAACAAMCFMYLTPRWRDGKLVKNTKIAMTAPTFRQVHNIMTPEIRRLFRNAEVLPGRQISDDIRTSYEEWFLTGFKAEDSTEVWSGFHAVNTMFVVTEATGISETIYNAIEGNLQNNSRLLLVFNPNVTTGYAAKAMKSPRFKKFRLNSLNAENVVKKKVVIPGQVDYEWVKDKVETWCTKLTPDQYDEGMGDFKFEGGTYRPNDLFRVKVLGMFPHVAEDILIPYEWVEIANNRWQSLTEKGFKSKKPLRLGVDVAGMGRDCSCFVYRRGNFVERVQTHQSGGKADHMKVAGIVVQSLKEADSKAFIDTIGEGAGVYSRCEELDFHNAYSCKFSEGTKGLSDITGQYSFMNMRAYLFWALRDWLNPKNGFGAALPPDEGLMEELTDVHWRFYSNGSIIIEAKEEIIKRLGRSPDKMDALANTFYPRDYNYVDDSTLLNNIL